MTLSDASLRQQSLIRRVAGCTSESGLQIRRLTAHRGVSRPARNPEFRFTRPYPHRSDQIMTPPTPARMIIAADAAMVTARPARLIPDRVKPS